MNENSENQSKICTLVTKKRRTGPLVSGKEGEKILYAFRFSRIRIHDRKNGIILHHRDIQKSPAPEKPAAGDLIFYCASCAGWT